MHPSRIVYVLVFVSKLYLAMIADAHGRVHVFIVRFVFIRVQLMRFPFANIEVIHTLCMNSYKVLRKIIMVPLELDISPALTTRSVVISPHSLWCSTPVDP